MQNKPLIGFYIDPVTNTAEPREIVDNLDNFYELLACDTIDITTRCVQGVRFDVVCDDNGLLVEKPIPSALFPDGHVALVGRLFLCFDDTNEPNPEGELLSLSPPAIMLLRSRVVLYELNGKDFTALLLDAF